MTFLYLKRMPLGTTHHWLRQAGWLSVRCATIAIFVGCALGQSSQCDLNLDGGVTATDVQIAIEQLLGNSPCTSADIDGNGMCGVGDVQLIVNAALSGICRSSPSFSARLIAVEDCSGTCDGKVTRGDTTIFTAWAEPGSTTVNGTSVAGTLYGTMNDGNVRYTYPTDGKGPNCVDFNVIWLKTASLDMIKPDFWQTVVANCMSSFNTDVVWAPAPRGSCSLQYVGHEEKCDWKSQGNLCVGVTCYLQVLRQEQVGGGYYGHDSTLVKTTDGGLTWTNPAHVGGEPATNGDAPAGPGDPSYPASILWPDPPSHNGVDQKMARCQFAQYGRAGASWPEVDNNRTYVYCLTYDGAFSQNYLARIEVSQLPKLRGSDWSYYTCPGYSSSVCNGLEDKYWSSKMSDATPVASVGQMGLGGVVYSAELKAYIATGGNIGTTALNTSPHIWGPWTKALRSAAGEVTGLGFVSPMAATLKTVVPGKSVQLTLSATFYTHDSTGTIGYVTYEISK